MVQACFRLIRLYWETLAHRKQKPALSYAKERVLQVVSLGTNKFFLLLLFIFFGVVKISAQSKIKDTTNRVSKTVRRITDTVMRGTDKVLILRQSVVKHDTVIIVKVDTVYFPKIASIEAESLLGFAIKALPIELMRLFIEGIIFLSLTLIWKKLKFYFYLLRR